MKKILKGVEAVGRLFVQAEGWQGGQHPAHHLYHPAAETDVIHILKKKQIRSERRADGISRAVP
jgi:hypothetical protein